MHDEWINLGQNGVTQTELDRTKNYLIISILLDLLKHETIKASNLAAKNEVSVRTIYRYIDALEEAGVPTVSW